jgi:hypothetical protein
VVVEEVVVVVVPVVPLRQAVLTTFRNQIGVRETGPNTGPEVNMYLGAVGFDPGYAWCGALIGWGYLKHSISIPKSAAWSPAWFPAARTIDKEQAREADVFGIYFQSLQRIGHVGVLDETWNNGSNMIYTIEGNTNSAGGREGDGVYRKRRSKNQIYRTANWIDK